LKKSFAITTGQIYDQYVDLSKTVHYTSLTQRQVADFISELGTLGIITARVISKGRHGKTREIEVTVSSTELARILQKDELSAEIGQIKMKNQTRIV